MIKDWVKAQIVLRFRNSGASSTGHIHAIIESNWTRSNNINIQNIEGLTSDKRDIEVWHKNCYDASVEVCDETVVPYGIRELILKIECANCDPEKFNRTIKICIFNSTSKECDQLFN